MVTEYEQLLAGMLKERREKLEALRASKERNRKKKVDTVLSEIGFIQVELERYQRGLVLFRSKGLPKVGRWGKPETPPPGESQP